MKSTNQKSNKPELRLTRVINAPIELVYKAWTDAKQVAQWWGPTGFTAPRCELDVKPGGKIHIDMRGPDGTIYPMTGTFTEVDEPRRLAFTAIALNAKGEDMFEDLTVVSFESQSNKTLVTVEATILRVMLPDEAQPAMEGMNEGWTQTIDRMEGFANNTGTQVFITRTFNATREQVFKAWTDPELLLQWYAPRNCTIHFTKLDARTGGTYLSCVKIPDYKDCWCVGEYKEVIAPEKIVFTMAVSDEHGNRITAIDAGMHPEWPDETTVTVTFTEENGKTKLTLHQTVSQALAKETGAYPSWLEMFDRLEELS